MQKLIFLELFLDKYLLYNLFHEFLLELLKKMQSHHKHILRNLSNIPYIKIEWILASFTCFTSFSSFLYGIIFQTFKVKRLLRYLSKNKWSLVMCFYLQSWSSFNQRLLFKLCLFITSKSVTYFLILLMLTNMMLEYK